LTLFQASIRSDHTRPPIPRLNTGTSISGACSGHSVSFLFAASLIAITVSATTFVFGQTYPFQKYTTADGLSHAAVRKVFQDSRGVLWFGTQEGVDSYDGRAFREYLKFRPDSYPVYEIFEDKSGILWLGTYGFGLIKLLPSGTTQPVKSLGDTLLQSCVTAITEDAHGTIWVGSDDGLFSFQPDGRRTRVNGLDGTGEIYALVADTNGTIEKLHVHSKSEAVTTVRLKVE